MLELHVKSCNWVSVSSQPQNFKVQIQSLSHVHATVVGTAGTTWRKEEYGKADKSMSSRGNVRKYNYLWRQKLWQSKRTQTMIRLWMIRCLFKRVAFGRWWNTQNQRQLTQEEGNPEARMNSWFSHKKRKTGPGSEQSSDSLRRQRRCGKQTDQLGGGNQTLANLESYFRIKDREKHTAVFTGS